MNVGNGLCVCTFVKKSINYRRLTGCKGSIQGLTMVIRSGSEMVDREKGEKIDQ